MGPNGSGKSTLVNALMGNPNYEVTGGTATLNGEDILDLPPDERAKVGLFLGFQYPSSIPGVTVANFLRTALVSLSKPRARTESELLTETGEVRRDADPTPATGLEQPTYVGKAGVTRAGSNPALKEFRKNLREKLGLAEDGRGLRHPLRQRRLLRRREEAPRSAPDGDAQAEGSYA